ncbi:MAG: hypothetical protein KKC24_11480 [Gammaproteobacteria bacterium]|nr:hypothetical protein [Gammaproteobacteria bacterium]MBU0819462.1 hypothetical protein [Gammaproteobacteria bacterium]MBU0843392.1 hypothetical protein [Gammaproteobacteria bacterium]MBU1838629.1 hypothetical protein [Gammaproteobacteria bacterium]
MTEIICIGRDGQSRNYTYTITKNLQEDQWCYRFRSAPPPASGEAFEITVSLISDSEVRVIAMYNNGEGEYVAKGIPDVGIPLIASELEKTVCSSPNLCTDGVFRTLQATKVWQRLVDKGQAIYSETEDVFRTT